MTSGQLHIQPNTMEVGNSNQELLSKGSKKKTTIVILVIILIASGVAALLYFLKPESTPMRTSSSYTLSKRSIAFKSFIEGEFTPKSFNGTWVSDYELMYKSKAGGIMLYNALTNTTKELLGADSEVLASKFKMQLSADHRYLLLASDYQRVYRHSFLAFYTIVDLETKKSWPLTDLTGTIIPIQLVVWAPVGNALAYVYMNDIFYRSTAKEHPTPEFRLTRTGRPGTIYNGIPDWVYEEEIFASNKALWFSPDARYISFATFNDSRTPVMNIPYYGVPGDVRYQYTQAVNIRYPKPGRPNPIVSLSVVDLAQLQIQKTTRELDLPPRPDLKEPVLFQVDWATPDSLAVVWMNRVQNQASVTLFSAMTGAPQQTMALEEKKGWVIYGPVMFSPDSSHMAAILPVDQGEIGRYRHIVLVDLSNNNFASTPLTSGKFVVTSLVGFDNKHIYFHSTDENEPGKQRVNRVSWINANSPQTPECVSCNYPENEECNWSGATFSKKNSFFALSCQGPGVPNVRIVKKDGDVLQTWENNSRLKRKLETITLPETKYTTVPIGENMDAHVKLTLPPDMDYSGKTKYPVLVQVYAGPDTNFVDERFSVYWDTYLSVNKSIIYMRIDGRGSGNNGDSMTYANYRNLGTYEVYDQINVTRHLIQTLPYIDPNRVAVWGWSYGGYVTGMILATDTKNIFKCGISVAPVTDWLLYDTLYTERFMGLPTPEDNLKGYEAASLNNKVENFRNKKYLLIHGTLDDNVHYQQSMMLAKALELKDILFDQQSYPDETHGLVDVHPHLYHSMGHFLNQCFGLEG